MLYYSLLLLYLHNNHLRQISNHTHSITVLLHVEGKYNGCTMCVYFVFERMFAVINILQLYVNYD